MRRSTGVLTLLTALVACSDATGTGRRAGTSDVSVQFCLGQGPNWFAYRNEGGDWTSLPASVFQSTYGFAATPTVTIAYARAISFASVSQVYVLNLTAEEVDHLRCSGGSARPKQLTGSVRLPGANDDARILMGSAVSFIAPGVTSYSISVNDGPLDLFALARALTPGGSSRVIVRHDVNLPEGAAIPLLDFTTAEARPFGTSTLTVQGTPENAGVTARLSYVSARGTEFFVGAFGTQGGAATLATIPPALLRPGDVHRVSLSMSARGIDYDLVFSQHEARDTTVTFGPALSVPTFDVVARSPMLRPRVRLDRQPSYPSLVQVIFEQSNETSSRAFVVQTTAAFQGSSHTTWDVSVPDLTGAPGFQGAWGLTDGRPIDASVRAWDARTVVYFGNGTPSAGEGMRAATAFARMAATP
jgi:hypothetical protein